MKALQLKQALCAQHSLSKAASPVQKQPNVVENKKVMNRVPRLNFQKQIRQYRRQIKEKDTQKQSENSLDKQFDHFINKYIDQNPKRKKNHSKQSVGNSYFQSSKTALLSGHHSFDHLEHSIDKKSKTYIQDKINGFILNVDRKQPHSRLVQQRKSSQAQLLQRKSIAINSKPFSMNLNNLIQNEQNSLNYKIRKNSSGLQNISRISSLHNSREKYENTKLAQYLNISESRSSSEEDHSFRVKQVQHLLKKKKKEPILEESDKEQPQQKEISKRKSVKPYQSQKLDYIIAKWNQLENMNRNSENDEDLDNYIYSEMQKTFTSSSYEPKPKQSALPSPQLS